MQDPISANSDFMINLTSSDFEYFKNRCLYWINKLNLNNWKITFLFCNDLTEERALTTIQHCDKIALIQLSSYFDIFPEKKLYIELDQTAYHECLEILLSGFYYYATSRNFNENDYTKENHSIIRTLENLIFNPDNLIGSGFDTVPQDNLLGSCNNEQKTGITDEAPMKGTSNGY